MLLAVICEFFFFVNFFLFFFFFALCRHAGPKITMWTEKWMIVILLAIICLWQPGNDTFVFCVFLWLREGTGRFFLIWESRVNEVCCISHLIRCAQRTDKQNQSFAQNLFILAYKVSAPTTQLKVRMLAQGKINFHKSTYNMYRGTVCAFRAAFIDSKI